MFEVQSQGSMFISKSVPGEIIIALLTTVVVGLVCYPLQSYIGYQSVGLIFLISIPALSLFLGRRALLVAALSNFAVWNYFFIEPLYTFRVHSLHDLIALFTNLIVAVAAGSLISRARKSELVSRSHQSQLQLVYNFLESLNNSVSIKDVVKRAGEGISRDFQASMVVYLKEKNSNALASRPFGELKLHSDTDFQGAQAVFTQNDPEKFAHRNGVFSFLLNNGRERIGVSILSFHSGCIPGDNRIVALQACLGLLASALEREIIIDRMKEKEITAESEKLFRTVLNSVSHELKTPVSIISAAAANLSDPRTSSDPLLRKQIAEELEDTSLRLNHIVENILDMSRLDSGLLAISREECDLVDLVGVVNHDLRISENRLKIQFREPAPVIKADIHLLKQALANVVHNALTYSPSCSVIQIFLSENERGAVIEICDEGPGVPEQSLKYLCDKFYRVPGSRSGGTGLGLAISKAILELHGGRVEVANRPEGGLKVKLILPEHDG